MIVVACRNASNRPNEAALTNAKRGWKIASVGALLDSFPGWRSWRLRRAVGMDDGSSDDYNGANMLHDHTIQALVRSCPRRATWRADEACCPRPIESELLRERRSKGEGGGGVSLALSKELRRSGNKGLGSFPRERELSEASSFFYRRPPPPPSAA